MGDYFLFNLIVFANILSQVVVLVPFGTVLDGLFHPPLYAVDIVQQGFLCFLRGVWTLLDDTYQVRDFLRALGDGVV